MACGGGGVVARGVATGLPSRRADETGRGGVDLRGDGGETAQGLERVERRSGEHRRGGTRWGVLATRLVFAPRGWRPRVAGWSLVKLWRAERFDTAVGCSLEDLFLPTLFSLGICGCGAVSVRRICWLVEAGGRALWLISRQRRVGCSGSCTLPACQAWAQRA